MSAEVLWLVAAGVLLAVEMLTGSFYLMLFAAGAAIAAGFAWLGLPLGNQIAVAAVVSIGSALILRHARRGRSPQGSVDLSQMDVGSRVEVHYWGSNGLARVVHRGTHWSARPARPELIFMQGHFIVVAVEGSTLVLDALPSGGAKQEVSSS